jgi:integrase
MRPEGPTLRLDQLDRLAEAVPGNYRVLILVARVLGLRWSECVGLQIGDVNFLRRTLSLQESLAILSNPGAVQEIREAESEIDHIDVVTADQLRAKYLTR